MENPALLARLRSESNLLAVAGRVNQELGEAAVDAIRELAKDALATWVILHSPTSTPEVFTRGWPALLGGGTVPTVHLGLPGDPPPVPAFLLESCSGLRQGLFLCHQARKFETSLDMVEERVQQDLRHQEARRKTLLRRAAAINDMGHERALREVSERVRREVGDCLARLGTRLGESQRLQLLPGSVASNQINNLLEDITTKDLARQESGRIIELCPARELINKAEQLVQDRVRAALHEDLSLLHAELESLGQNLITKLTAVALKACRSRSWGKPWMRLVCGRRPKRDTPRFPLPRRAGQEGETRSSVRVGHARPHAAVSGHDDRAVDLSFLD